jgi:hypothetical protein
LHEPFRGEDSSRITTFNTDQPVTAIQQFYRTALPRRGWHYLCTVTPTNPPCRYSDLRPEAEEVREVYEPGPPVLAPYPVEITILRSDARGMRTVQIHEVVVDRSDRMPCSTDPTGPPPVALVGQWRGTDAASGNTFILKVYQDNRVEVPRTVAGGTYQWDGDTAIRVIFTERSERVVGEAEDGVQGLCRTAPAFLKAQCAVQAPLDAAYPGPEETALLMPSVTVTPDPAYPGPAPPATEPVSSQIDAAFTVAVNADTLTLTNASGMTQTFQRVDGT